MKRNNEYGLKLFFIFPFILIALLLLFSCKSEVVEPTALSWEISGTWQNVNSKVFTDSDYEYSSFSANLVEQPNNKLSGKIETLAWNIFGELGKIPFTITNGSFVKNTIILTGVMETTYAYLHFEGTLKNMKRLDTGETVKVIVGYVYFEYLGMFSKDFKVYLIQQEIIYQKRTWHNQGGLQGY